MLWQVLYVNCVSVGWTCTLSFIAHGGHTSLESDPLLPEARAAIDSRSARPSTLPVHATQAEDTTSLQEDTQLHQSSTLVAEPSAEQKFDSWISSTFSEKEVQSMQKYREDYQEFRKGEAHGCKGEHWNAVIPDRISWELEFRQEYGSFRKGAAYG